MWLGLLFDDTVMYRGIEQKVETTLLVEIVQRHLEGAIANLIARAVLLLFPVASRASFSMRVCLIL